MTPLRPLMQTNVKPPSPLRAPEQQALKPMTLSSPGFCGGLFRPLPFVLLCVGFLLVAV